MGKPRKCSNAFGSLANILTPSGLFVAFGSPNLDRGVLAPSETLESFWELSGAFGHRGKGKSFRTPPKETAARQNDCALLELAAVVEGDRSMVDVCFVLVPPLFVPFSVIMKCLRNLSCALMLPILVRKGAGQPYRRR